MCHRARERGLSKGKVALNAVGYKKKEEKKVGYKKKEERDKKKHNLARKTLKKFI